MFSVLKVETFLFRKLLVTYATFCGCVASNKQRQPIRFRPTKKNTIMARKALPHVVIPTASVGTYLEALPTRPQFIAVREYTSKESGEIATHIINIGISHNDVRTRDIKTLQTLLGTLEPGTLRHEACAALLASMVANTNDETRSAQSSGQLNAFVTLAPGLEQHTETGAVYVTGYAIRKHVKTKGTYKTVKSAPLTIEKNDIRKLLLTSKRRRYCVGAVTALTMGGRRHDFISVTAAPTADV